MKKLFLTLFFACGIFALLSQGELLWSQLKSLDQARVHKVQKGEYLSKLAKAYYGDAQHWRELALINRAPNANHIQVGEEILLPSSAVMNELSRSRTLTRVNALVGDEARLGTHPAPESPSTLTESTEPASEPATTAPVETPTTMTEEGTGTLPEPSEPEMTTLEPEPVAEDAGFPWFWLAIGLIMIAGVVGFILYRRKQSQETEVEVETVGARNRIDDFARERRPFVGPQNHPKENTTVL
jgi:LysM repeat protein